MKTLRLLVLAGIAAIFLPGASVSSFGADARHFLPRHVPAMVSRLQAQGELPATNQLRLAIGLPLRNTAALTNLMAQLYNPASPQYHHYLTPEQFNEQFGPTEADYQKVVAFAQRNGLRVAGTHGDRILLDVTGSVADIEKTFQVTLRTYQHPTEKRTFFAPDTEPSVEAGVPVLDVSGLSDYGIPRPQDLETIIGVNSNSVMANLTGSSPNGYYCGNDFRAAYLSGISPNLNGAGQTVGLLEFDGYYSNDIAIYENTSGLTNHVVPLQNVYLDGAAATNQPGGNNIEVALDIEVAIAMAPALARVVVFEAPNSTAYFNDMLSAMSSSNLIQQLSCSWSYSGTPNASMDQYFQKMIMQGQSFFDAAGDTNAYVGSTGVPNDDPNITICGGTTLTTAGPGGSWVSEKVWNSGGGVGGSGGISTYYSIPDWQTGIAMTANQGSTTMRNIPDVALTADQVWCVYNNGSTGGYVRGTSIAAPLWAGLTALANQQAAIAGSPPVGFLNPVIYEIGRESVYAANFNDITSGNNFWSGSPAKFSAVPGYDLCTGWGTPNGTNLLNALMNPDALTVTPNGGFNASESTNGTFNVAAQIFYLTNAGASTLTWTLVNIPSWLNVSSNGGALAGGADDSVAVSLNPVATNLTVGIYTANLGFSNVASSVTHYRFFTLTVSETLVQNGGFETGDFTGWTLDGAGAPYNFVTNSFTYNAGSNRHPNIITINPHSGNYFAALAGTNSQAWLSQTLPTSPGQKYLLSLWMDSPDGLTPNEFSVSWNGSAIFDQLNLPKLGWTNLQFIVTAMTGSTVLQIGARDDPAWLALDDVSVIPGFAPAISGQPTNLTLLAGGNITFSATASGSPPLVYQWQKNGTSLVNGGGISGAITNTLSLTAVTTNSSGNYSLIVTNSYGITSSNLATLTVVVPPSFTGSVTNRTIECGSNNVTFSITAAGTPPLSYQWVLDNVTNASATNSTYSITNLHQPDHTISVTVTNLYGSVTSNALLTVHDSLAPVITLNGGNPIFVELGGTFSDPGATANDACAGAVGVIASGTVNTNAVGTNTLTYSANDGNGNTNIAARAVIVRDTTPPTILWSFTNLVLALDTNCSALMPDVTGTNFILATDLSGALTITQNPTNNFVLPLGTNSVVITVTDASGNAAFSTNNIIVQDQTPPQIFGQPQNQTNFIGDTANFSVAATACTPLGYQWFFGTNVLANQTNSLLSLTNVSLASAGNYSVIATADGGSTTSAVATLTVYLRPANIALNSSANPSGFNDNVNFSAAITPTNSTGLLQLLTNGILFDVENLVAGQVVSTNISSLPRGTNLIAAIYSGDADDLPSTNSLAQIVTNHPPVAATVFYTRAAGLPLNIAVADFATNWSDVDGDSISLAAIGITTNGVTLTNNLGTLVYDNSNNVADQFICTINDDYGGTNFQTVNIAVVFPNINSVAANADGSFTLSLNGAPGYAYVLETTTNLTSPVSWQAIATNTLGTNGVWQFTDTQATNYPQQFYRLKLAP